MEKHDVVLQTPAVGLLQRLLDMHSDPRVRDIVFPPELRGMQMSLLEPQGSDKVSGLLLLPSCPLTAQQLSAWLADAGLAWAIVRIFWLSCTIPPAASQEELLEQVVAAGMPAGALRLQCFPRTLETWLGDVLPEEWPLHPVSFHSVLNVIQTGPHSFRRSLQPAAGYYQYRHEGGPRIPDQLCRAAGKLVEALRVCGFPLEDAAAIDVGAAPGGWTQVLSQRGARLVVAVDPALMDERALGPNVHHLQCKAEEALEQIQALLGSGGQADVLVSDVNHHPARASKMLQPLLPLLRPGGLAVLTLKFYGKGPSCDGWEDQMAQQLGPEFEGVHLIHLLANTAYERTVLARKKGGGGSPAAPTQVEAAAAAPPSLAAEVPA